jgi:hypothetical protein
LLIDPNAMLTLQVTLQRFKVVVGWNFKVSQRAGGIKHLQLAKRSLLDRLRNGAAGSAIP